MSIVDNINMEDYFHYSIIKNNIRNVEDSDQKEYILTKEEYLRLLNKEKDAFVFLDAIRISNNQNRKILDETKSQQVTIEELEQLSK